MSHCTRCRADAVGLLGEQKRPEMEIALLQAAGGPLNPAEDRPYVAVATLEGVLVNQHLGEADQLNILQRRRRGFSSSKRPTPPAGGGSQRWHDLAEALRIAGPCWSPAPARPRAALASRGIKLVMMEGLIDEGLDAVFRGRGDSSAVAKKSSLWQRLFRQRPG